MLEYLYHIDWSGDQIKILVMTSTFPRWEKDTEPRFVSDLCLQLAHKHEIHVLAPHAFNTKTYEVEKNIQIHRFRYCLPRLETLAYNGGILPNLKRSPVKALLIPLFLFGQLWKTFSLVRSNEYDIIHAHWIIPQGITAAIIKMLYKDRVKLILTSHGGDLFSLQGRFLTKIKQWILNRCDHISVVSAAMADSAISLGVAQKQISIAPMGVDLHHTFIPPLEPTDREGIIFVGRLVDKKGVEYLIKAFSMVLKKYPNETLTIIGSGPLQQNLMNLAKSTDTFANIKFMGAVENRLIPNELRKAKIAVVPSIITKGGDQEGFGLTIVEAMGCECAVIASDLPAISDIISNDKYGLLVKPEDSTDIAEKILSLLEDPELVKNISQFGRANCLQKFDWIAVGNNYQRIFSDVVKAAV